MSSTTSPRPTPTTFKSAVGRAWCLGVLVFSGWAGCQANSDGFSYATAAQGGKATGTAGQTGGALATGGQMGPDGAVAGSPALDAGIPLLSDGAAGGSILPLSTGSLARDAGSSGVADALGGTTGGAGGQGTGTIATGGNALIPDAGTPTIDAPVGGTMDALGGFGGSGGATGGKGGISSTTKGGTTGGAKGGTSASSSASRSGGATAGNVSAPPDAGIDAVLAPDALVPADADKDEVGDASPWQLVWSDEFDREANAGVVSSKWNVSTWDPGTVNEEVQKYTARPQNVYHDGHGHLVLSALKDSYRVGNTTYPYTSGRIQSDDKFTFKFGRIEISAKLPAGKGSFPGMILMGTNGGWPQCGEIGLMEQNGWDKTSITCSTYSNSPTDSTQVTFPSATFLSEQFHTYALEWYADHMVFFVDDAEVARKEFGNTSPFANAGNDFYIILDVALGGNMGGAIEDADFPMDMILDYVRVYTL